MGTITKDMTCVHCTASFVSFLFKHYFSVKHASNFFILTHQRTEEAAFKTSYKCTNDIGTLFYFRDKGHRKQSDLSSQPWYFLPAFLKTKIKMLPFRILSPEHSWFMLCNEGFHFVLSTAALDIIIDALVQTRPCSDSRSTA